MEEKKKEISLLKTSDIVIKSKYDLTNCLVKCNCKRMYM